MLRRCARWWISCMAADITPIAVLLMAYGGPGNLAEVEPYLMDVRGGRATKPQLVEEIRTRYARIGGGSPILGHTRAQAAGVERVLGKGFRTYVGMRHWHPYIKDTVDEIRRGGHDRLVGVVMAPHYSSMSVGAYEKKLLDAIAGEPPIETALVRSWWGNPNFLDAVAQNVTQALQRFPRPKDVQVVFTAHSLPQVTPTPSSSATAAKRSPGDCGCRIGTSPIRAPALRQSPGSAPPLPTSLPSWPGQGVTAYCSCRLASSVITSRSSTTSTSSTRRSPNGWAFRSSALTR